MCAVWEKGYHILGVTPRRRGLSAFDTNVSILCKLDVATVINTQEQTRLKLSPESLFSEFHTWFKEIRRKQR